MSVELLAGQGHAGNDNLGELLAGVIRLLKGAVAAEYIPRSTAHNPVVWADLNHAGVASALHDATIERFSDGGPWGEAIGEGWTAWIEPAAPGEGGSDDDSSSGVLAIAFKDRPSLTHEEIRTVRMFARLCGSVTRPRDPTSELAQQRRLDDLVSTISERLMSTTGTTLQSALDWAVERLTRFLGADFAFLRRNDHLHGMSVLMAFYPPRGVPLEEDPLGIVPFDADPIFAATKDMKVPIIVRDATQTDDRYRERVRDAAGVDQFTGAGVPLVHGDTTEGILAFVYLSTYTWSEQEVNALRAVAALLVQLMHRIDAEERLRHNALTDDLTGLPNRRALLEEVSRRQATGGHPLGLLFIDLDRFKVMNDQLGHGAGDTVLQVIADRIRTSLRANDFAARLGGDEFVVLLEDADGGLAAIAAATRLLDLISLPIEVRGQRVAHTGSVGIAVSDSGTVTGEDLLGRADMALYEAKSQGRSRVVVFDEELEERVAQRASIELLLRQALSENALRLHYQPEFDLLTGKLVGVEALVRWQRPGQGLVQAAQFVPIAEETHLITDIDRWVLEEASSQMATWRRTYPASDLVVRVNMSAAQLSVAGVVRTVADCLRRSGLPSRQLCLEITEEAVIADVEQAVRLLRDIRSMGVQLAIDDFGTGQSSMSQLKNLPVDVLKIDRVFVDGISTDPTDQAIVEAIVRLAEAFGLQVVGEGVETIADLETLVRLGCRRAQGYLLARPLPPEEVEAIIAQGGLDLDALRQPQMNGSRRA